MKEVLRSLGQDFLEQKQKLRSNELFHQFGSILYTLGHLSFRHILQLHHDDGGEQCGVDCGGAQLSPQDRRDPRHAYVGAECFSPVAALATQVF